MDFEIISRFGDRFLDGTLLTLQLVFLASVAGLIIAVPVALARTAQRASLWIPAYCYIYFLRGTPLLIQLFLIYYGLGQFESVRNSPAWHVLGNAEWCGGIALTLNTSAYIAEILRGAIQGIPRGQVEAAKACGMSYPLRTRRIILPQAVRIAWPAYGNEVILLLKSSALLSTIAVWDLMGETRSIFSRTYSLDVFIYAGLIYFAMTFVLTRVFALIERRLSRHLGSAATARKDPTATANGKA